MERKLEVKCRVAGIPVRRSVPFADQLISLLEELRPFRELSPDKKMLYVGSFPLISKISLVATATIH